MIAYKFPVAIFQLMGKTMKFTSNGSTETTCHALPNILDKFRLRRGDITVKTWCTIIYGRENVLPFFLFQIFSTSVIYEDMGLW